MDKELQEEKIRWINAGLRIPTQSQMDAVTELAGTFNMYGDELGWILTEQVLPSYPGIHVYVLARDCVVIYWAGDTRIRALIRARTVEDLPELLVCSDLDIRVLAQKKLEALKAL